MTLAAIDRNVRYVVAVFTTITAAMAGVLVPMTERGKGRRLREVDARLRRAVKSRERHRDGLAKQLRECLESEIYRRKGELLKSHLYELTPAVLRAGSVTLADWSGWTDGTNGTEGELVTIALDPKLSPSKNAERYFKKYRKAHGDEDAIRAKLAAVESAISEILGQRDLLESVGRLDGPEVFESAVRDVESWLDDGAGSARKSVGADRKSGKRGKSAKNSEPPHLVYEFSAEGLVVLVGLSARGNRFVTFREARPDDLWLHAHELPGAHVIIRSVSGRPAGELRRELETEHRDVLEFAAALAAGHSRGCNSAWVAVDYTERKHVRPVPGTVALVTYTEPGTLRVKPA